MQTVPFDTVKCTLNKSTRGHHVPRIIPSALHTEFTAKRSTKKETPPHIPEEAALQGTLIHACFEHGVEWLDDPINDNDHELRELIDDMLKGQTLSFTAEDILTEFRTACQRREIIDALSRSRYLPDTNPELERERRFALWIDDKKIMRGSIDRFVIQRDLSGALTRIEILDYKTGGSMDDIDRLVEPYRKQLEAYRQAVSQLYNVSAEIVDTTLVFVTMGKAVTVSALQKKG
jgi:ATP-dependent exoDNAse (exonuclease V) beta subunit